MMVIGLLMSSSFPCSDGLAISSAQRQTKQSIINGQIQVTVAQWDLEFDEDIYFWSGPPCAPGLALPHNTPEAVAANPCWAGCDFATKGSGCGLAFNSSDPTCVAQCEAHPEREKLCNGGDDWVVLEPDQESPVLMARYGYDTFLRMNWLKPGQGFKIDIISLNAHTSFGGFPSLAAYSSSHYCYGSNDPDPWGMVCPSSQCFNYGTHLIAVGLTPKDGHFEYEVDFSVIVRTFQTASGPRVLTPPADVPATFPVSVSPFHTPLQFGVTADVYFAPFETLRFFQLTTMYCGMVSLQTEPSVWNRTVGRYALGLSTNPANPVPVDPFTDIIFAQGTNRALWVCPPDDETPAILYIAVSRLTFSFDDPLWSDELHYLTVDVPRSGTDWRVYKFGDHPTAPKATAVPWIVEDVYTKYTSFPIVNNFADGVGANSMELTCPDPDNATLTKQFLCRAGSSGYGTCLDFLLVHPSLPFPSTLTPVPQIVRDLNRGLFSVVNYSQPQTRPRSISAMLLLAYSFEKSDTQYPLGPNWPELLPQCQLSLVTASPFASLEGMWLQQDLQPPEVEPSCDLEQLTSILDGIQQNIKNLRANPSDALTQRVKTDLSTFLPAWQACNQLVQTVLMNATSQDVVVPETEICLTADPSDPCCDPNSSWFGCCQPRTIDANISWWIEDTATVEGLCGNPTCLSPVLADYASQTSFEEIGGCLVPLPQETAALAAYRQCLIDDFGEDYMTRTCVIDADCQSALTVDRAFCSQITHTCGLNYTASLSPFFNCLADTMPTPVRISMLQRNNWLSRADQLATLLQDKFGGATGCLTDAGSPWSPLNWYLTYFSGTGCADIPYSSADPTRQLPPWADLRAGAFCPGIVWEGKDRTFLCGTTTVCNWDPADCQNLTNTDPNSFCGVCETPASCFELPAANSASLCQQQQSVCFLANGTLRTDLTADQCANTFSCSMSCPGGQPCTGPTDCEAQGYCQLRDDVFTAIQNSPWSQGYEGTGFCVQPMSPENNPDCGLLYAGAIPSSYGCVVYGDCVSVTDLTCTANYLTPQSCAAAGGTWYDEQTTKAQCLAATGCQVDNSISSSSRLGSTLLAPKNSSECRQCGGQEVTLSTWVAGRWLGGTSRPTQWLPRQRVSVDTLTDRYIDFRALFLEIYFSSVAALSFQLENNLQCTYSGVGFSVGLAVCDCTTNFSTQCYPTQEGIDIGRGQVCPHSPVVITAYPAILIANNESLAASYVDECVNFALIRQPAVEFARLPAGVVTTGFVHRPQQQRSKESYEVVVNDGGAIVGQLIGDPIKLEFSSDRDQRALHTLRVCLAPSSNIRVQNLQRFSVYDLAYLSGSGKFVPLGLTSAFNGSYICGDILFTKLPTSNRQFAPVMRSPNYNKQSNERLSSGEVALMYVVASLYAVLFAITMTQVIRLIALSGFSVLTPTNLLWLIFALMVCIRSIYFYLVAADVLGQPDSLELVDMWMIDLPTLLYLIGNLLIALSFLFLHMGAHDYTHFQKQSFWLVTATITLLLLLIFVATLLAFNYVVVEQQGLTGPPLCPTYDDRSQQASIIRTVYEAVILFVSICIALIALVFSAVITKELERVGSTMILKIGIVSSLGIIADSLAFLIYYAINQPHPYFAIVLIFTEILPILFIVLTLSTHQIKNTSQNSSLTRAGRGSSGGSAGLRRESID